MEVITILISIFSTVVAIIALYISTKTLDEQKRIAKITNNYALLFQASTLIVDNPKLLELHNISKKDLDEIGVTQIEVIYILQSIISAESYYEIENPKHVNYKEFSDYRKNLLNNHKVKLVWTNFMRQKLVFASPFVLAVDDFYENQYVAENKKTK